MPHRRRLLPALLALAALACSPCEKGADAASPAARDSAPATLPAAGTTPGGEGRAAVPERTKAVSPPRDSAFGPKLEVDSTGKVQKIKRP